MVGAMMLSSPKTLHLCVLICCLLPLLASKLNVPRVLLPYNHEIPSNFTLKVFEGGCYQWSCSRSEVVLLTEVIEDGCANEVQVSAISRSPSRQTAIILAQDSGSGGILRCDVLVDTIHRLEIVTTTRELYVEEAPEEFEVRAYDDQGNEFTTLEGIEMIWDLQTLTDRGSVVAAQTVLKFMTFDESPYEMPPSIAPLEESGRMGYMALIEGRQTGSARLSVRVAHPAYKHLAPSSVNLMVVANLLLDPADVYVLPHTAVKYTVFQLKQGHLSTIDIPASQFYLQVADTEIAELNDDGVSITAKTLGTTQVILKDNNVISSELVKQPTANIHVVDPSYLIISIEPHNNPALILGRRYAFIVNVYDKQDNKIFLADNIVMETTVPSEHFASEYVSRNGSYVYGVTIKTGKTKVQATLTAIEVGDTILEITPPLKASQEISIFDPIAVIPQRTVLPWDPVTKPVYSLNLTVVGGSGSVLWSSSNTEVVGVSQMGVCRTKAYGSVSVTAAMVLNPHNKDAAEIHIVEAIGLALLESVVEVEVEEKLPLHVASYTQWGDTKVPFTVCHQLPLKVEPLELTFIALPDVKTPIVKGSCATLEVVGKTPGFSEVKVSYKSSKGELAASTMVAAFRPLRPTNPSSGKTVLALGSSRVVLFEGGPLPWINKRSTHTAKAQVDDPEKVGVQLLDEVKQSDVHAIEVVCHDLGEFTLTLTVGNSPVPTLPHPRSVSSTLSVVCALPDAISLAAIIKRPVAAVSPCPAVAEIGVSVAHCYKPLSMEVIVTDSENLKFDNISSLVLKWNLSDETLASIPAEPSSLTQVSTVQGFSLPIKTKQMLKPTGEVGEVLVSVMLTGFNKFVSEAARQHPLPSLSASLPLKLVQDAVLEPSSAVLYQHEDNKLELTVAGGSGFFELQTAENDVASLAYMDKERIVTVQPISDGELTVTLVDVCLEAENPATSHIRIASIASLDLVIVDRVELGGVLEAEVLAKDSLGHPLPAHNLMHLTPHPQANIITARYQGVNSEGNAVYEVTGRHVGDTTLRVSAGNGGIGEALIYSPAKPIQVFPPLVLHPRNITLIIGAVYQVETKGGPYPDAVVEYSMVNETIASTSHAGIVTALSLGTTVLMAQAVSVSIETGRKISYSRDVVIINVIPLEKIRIHAPLTHLETGTTMPLYALGSEDYQNPLAYATAVPPLLFEWSINNKQIASFIGIYRKNGLLETKENNGIVRVRAERPGRVSVTLKVKPRVPANHPHFQIIDNVILTDKLEIKVFESLKLKYPDDGSSHLLLSPHAEAKITTNRDGDGQLSYKIERCDEGEGKKQGVITVSPDGMVKSGGITGEATVVVTIKEKCGISQSLAVLVEVKDISYMQAEVGAVMSVSPGESVSVMPLGSSLQLTLSYHDNRGRVFHATNAQPTFRPSRFDLVGVSYGNTNNSLLVDVRGSGQIVLHVWDENNALINDYLRISAGPAITPDRVTVPLGNHICLSSNVRGVEGSLGTWSASGDSLTLDPVSGVAVSHQIGRSTVSFEVSSALTTTTEINILPITKIIVVTPVVALTNGEQGSFELAVVVLEAEESSSSSCSPVDPPTSSPPFTCVVAYSPPIPEVDIKNVLGATATYVSEKGYACKIETLVGPLPSIATSDSAVIVEAVVVGRGQQGEVRSGPVTVPFYPSPVTDVSEVKLTNENPSVTIFLQGTPDVLNKLEVLACAVGSIEASLGSVDGRKRALTISSKDSLWMSELPELPITVSVSSPLTKNVVEVKVEVEQVGDGTCALPKAGLGILSLIVAVFTNYDQFLVSTACLIVIIACLWIGYYALFGPGYKQTQQKSVFANSPAPPVMPAFSPTISSSPAGGDSVAKRLNYSGSQSPSRIKMWTVNSDPIYGAPPYRRGAYEGRSASSTLCRRPL
ncbi:nuclear pore membrane glycoprotein 210-like isoform X2 [Homarus americanus]|uniref:nuclear pore membrane glycoprotein 210-like isoform X2 n=1 Tax=Homarus americanus TaxID=6706 RepID=UPI001C4751A9|nr:nuclear pore membrane glycoprotein 210-like isoform X2 [Homarus americanus]